MPFLSIMLIFQQFNTFAFFGPNVLFEKTYCFILATVLKLPIVLANQLLFNILVQATGTLKIGSYSGALMKEQIYSGGKNPH